MKKRSPLTQAAFFALFLLTPFFVHAQEFLWGMTKTGGSNNQGVVYRISSDGSNFIQYTSFNGTNGSSPGDGAGLTQIAYGSAFIGITELGGASGTGGAFSIERTGAQVAPFPGIDFNTSVGMRPMGKVTLGHDNQFYALTSNASNGSGSIVIFKFTLLGFPTQPGYVLNQLATFDGTNGGSPAGSLVVGGSGNMYGMTEFGGANSKGVIFVFKRLSNNTITKLVDFDGATKGANPTGSLIVGTDGKLYGMTKAGGAHDLGVIFSVNQDGSEFTKLYDFDGTTSGGKPKGSLVEFTDGKLYGMTSSGGASGFGTIFSITTNGAFAKITDFNGTNGKSPVGDLTVSPKGGVMFGTAYAGGANDKGTFFKLTNGTDFQKLYDFTTEGSNPVGSLMMDRQTQTISIESIPVKYKNTPPFPLNVKTGSGLKPFFAQDNAGVIIDNGTASMNLPVITQDFSGFVTTITPYQPGNYKYLPAYASNGALGLPPSTTITVIRAPQQITVQPIPDKKLGDEPFIVEATSSSGLPVNINSVSNAIVTGNTVSIVNAGLATIKFSQAGNGVFLPAQDVVIDVGVQKVDQTIAFDPPASKVCCNPFTITATAKTGVVFTVETPDIGSMESDNVVSPKKAGVLRVSAYAVENANYRPARVTKEIVIQKIPTYISVSSVNITAKFNSTPKYLAFTDYYSYGARIIATSDKPGIAVVDEYGYVNFVGVGKTRLTLTQAATDVTEASSPVFVDVTVDPPDTPATDNVITWNYSGINLPADQRPFNMIATASSGLPITFTSNNPGVIQMNGNQLTVVGTGTATITASQLGGNGIPVATPVSKIVIVSKAYQTILLPYVSTVSLANSPLYFPTVSLQGLPLDYTTDKPFIAEVKNFQLIIHGSGEVTVRASQAGNAQYNQTTMSTSYHVQAAEPSIYFQRIQAKTYGDAPFDLYADASMGIPVSFASSDPSVISISGTKATILKAGTTKISANTTAQGGYSNGFSEQTIVVAKKSQTITFDAIPGKKFADPNFIVKATATSNLPVSLTTTTPGIIKVVGNFVEITGSGKATLTARQPGNENYLKADSVVQTFDIEDSGHTFSLFMSSAGGPPNGGGSVFTIDSDGNNMQYLKGFDMPGNFRLTGGFVKDANGKLYMNSSVGGTTNSGTIVRIDSDGANFTVLASYSLDVTGTNPFSTPIIANDGYLYTTLPNSSNAAAGAIVRAKLDGSELKMIYQFSRLTGYKPSASLLQASDGRLYGMTDLGGLNEGGVVYSVKTDGSDYKVLRNVKNNNITSYVAYSRVLSEGSDGKIYGSAFNDGSFDAGTVFKMNKDGSGYEVIVDFENTNKGRMPGEIMIASDGRIYGMTIGTLTNNVPAIFSVKTDGTEFTKLLDIPGTGLQLLSSRLTEGSDGLLYGTVAIGGTNNAGSIFKVNKNGSGFEVIHSFDVAVSPFTVRGPLIEMSPGVFYGATSAGGPSNLGVIYKVTSSGDYTVLKSFTTSDVMSTGIGFDPGGDNYLGITNEPTTSTPGFFKLNTSNGSYQKFQAWPSNRHIHGSPLNVSTGHVWTYVTEDGGSQYIVRTKIDGTESTDIFSNSNPTQTGSSVGCWLERDGYVYGLTASGGANGKGTFFRMNIDGTGFTKLSDLPSNRPEFPVLLRTASDGMFYAMSVTNSGGTFFSLTREGVFTKIKSYVSSEVGSVKDMFELPNGEFAFLIDRNGSSDSAPASIFTVSKTGAKMSVIYLFNTAEGTSPVSFRPSMDGWLYVLTSYGGLTGDGGVFRIRTDGSSYTKIIDNNVGIGFDITSMFFKRAAQTLELDPIADKTVGDDPFALVYSTSSGAKPLLTSSDVSIAVIENGIVKIVGSGTVTISATLPGNNNFYQSNTVQQQFTVSKQDQSLTFTNPGTQKFEDGSFTLNGAATSGLPVVYKVTTNHVTISDNTATIVNAGSVTIEASQPGDNKWNAAAPISMTFCINPAIPTITISNFVQLKTSSTLVTGNQWYLNGTALPGATSQQIVATESGNYKVSSTIDGCKSESAPVSVIVTRIKDQLTDLVNVYPNPVSIDLSMTYDGENGSAMLRLMSNTGQPLGEITVPAGSTQVFDMSTFTAGIYILRIESDGKVGYKKIVKE